MTNPRAILALRFSSIGDIVQATSPIGTLRKLYPDARIDFMTLSKFAPLLEGHPHIDQVLSLDIDAGFRQLIKTGNYLDTLGYDRVFDFHNTLRTRFIRHGLRVTPVSKVIKPRWKRFKLFLLHQNSFSSDFNVRSWLHEPLSPYISNNMILQPTKLFVSNTEKESARKRVLQAGLEGEYLVVTPGAAWAQKRWEEQKYAAVIDYFRRTFGLEAVLLGGVNDDICNLIVKLSDSPVLDLHGITNLRESLAIISQARFVIGSDTGFLHAGEALGIPAITILGPTSRETGAGVFLPESRTISMDSLWCRPCSQNGSFPCYRKERFCMTGITSDRVIKEISKMMISI